MRKCFIIAMFCILMLSCSACREKNDDKKNLLGGYGEITQGAYANAYISTFFEDDVYIYFDNFKINKESCQPMNLCEAPGCRHDNPKCIEYKYENKIFPGNNKIYYIEGKTLYEINEEGDTEYIAAFDTDNNGIALTESVNIESVHPINDDVVFILCGEGSCLYNIKTNEKIYTTAYMCCGDDDVIYYYDTILEGIVKVDVKTMQTEFLENTKLIYPCFCANDKLYCNTETGIICSVDKSGNVEVCLADEGLRYILLGFRNDRMYYMTTDMDMVSGIYTSCDLYASLTDGTDSKKINTQNLKPDMSGFFGKDALYLLETGKFGGVKSIYVYRFDAKTENTYLIEDNEDNVSDIVTSEEAVDISEANSEEQLPKKSFAMATNFYAEVVDTLTGNKSQISQKTVPFKVDGNKLKTTFYYNVDVEGYPSEGYIYIFVMCDGILQKLSVDGNESALINRVEYKNKEDMYAEIEFLLENSSVNQEIIIGYYLSDSIITDDFDTFGEHNETISYTVFTYELENGYTLEDKMLPELYSEEEFNNVYTYEDGEKYEEIVETDIALISDSIPIKKQKERWSLQFGKSSSCYAVFHAQSGSYNMYFLVDDMPVPLFEEEECINCNITGDADTVVFDVDINEIINDEEKHNVKIMVYDKQTGNVKLYPAQIIQKED